MSDEAPFEFPDVVPYLYYADATQAVDWLCRVFGFTEHSAFRGDDGVVWSAQLRVGPSGLVMVGPGMSEFGTKAIDDRSGATMRIHVLVDDCDAHHARCVEGGAEILETPQDHGPVRIHIAVDPGGHQWIFAQPID